MLASASWLSERGYYRQLLDHYVKAGWLESPAHGVYRRPAAALKWQQVVASLQNVLDLPVHVGGITALELDGYAHFLQMHARKAVHLYSPVPLPSWLRKLPLTEQLVVRTSRLFNETDDDTHRHAKIARDAITAPHVRGIALKQVTWGDYDMPLTYSTPERAILEFLDDVPKRESISHANLLMQGLRTLSPRRVSQLLNRCRSVKVKRLFLALAERNNHPWLKELDVSGIDLGKGKRVLVPGGKLHPKYLITLPQDLDDSV